MGFKVRSVIYKDLLLENLNFLIHTGGGGGEDFCSVHSYKEFLLLLWEPMSKNFHLLYKKQNMVTWWGTAEREVGDKENSEDVK